MKIKVMTAILKINLIQIQALKSFDCYESVNKRSNRRNKAKNRSSSSENRRFYIVAVIPSKIFVVIGGPTFDDVFKSYDAKDDMFKEIPGLILCRSLHSMYMFLIDI